MHTNKNIASILVKLALIIGVIIGVWASLFQDGFYDPCSKIQGSGCDYYKRRNKRLPERKER